MFVHNELEVGSSRQHSQNLTIERQSSYNSLLNSNWEHLSLYGYLEALEHVFRKSHLEHPRELPGFCPAAICFLPFLLFLLASWVVISKRD